ncbi:MAG: hypothetical protein JRI68_09660 [Deltaproteobacteria bacterium]|nr:hypothetical protein [Deltaproteobacteria bacterium]
MSDDVRQRFDAIVEAGEAERVKDRDFVSIFTLDSELRYGLLDDLSWAMADGDQLIPFQSGAETAFIEVLEHPRSAIDERLEQGAAARGFPGEEVLFSFPAADIVRAVLAGSSQHFCRAALTWVLPTELRDLRDVIVAVAEGSKWPVALRQMAQRLVVRE